MQGDALESSIIIENFRFIKDYDGRYKFFHTRTTINSANISITRKNKTTPFITHGCNSMDESGFCKGHNITREEFVKTFCNNKDVPQLQLLKGGI